MAVLECETRRCATFVNRLFVHQKSDNELAYNSSVEKAVDCRDTDLLSFQSLVLSKDAVGFDCCCVC